MSVRDDCSTKRVAYARKRRRDTSAFIIIGCTTMTSFITVYSMCMTFGCRMGTSLGAGFMTSFVLSTALFAVYVADSARSRDGTA